MPTRVIWQIRRKHNFYATPNPPTSSLALLSLLSLEAFLCWFKMLEDTDGGKAGKNGCCLLAASFPFFLSYAWIMLSEAKEFGVFAPCFCSAWVMEAIEGTNERCMWRYVWENMSIATIHVILHSVSCRCLCIWLVLVPVGSMLSCSPEAEFCLL